METEITKFQETLCSLALIKNSIESCLRLMRRYPKDEDSKWIVHHMIWINLHSFCEEWRRLGGFVADNPEVRRTVSIASPAFDQIKKYEKAISQVRNKMSAHPGRGSNGRLISNLPRLFQQFNLPTTYDHIILLGECAVYAITICYVLHQQAHQQALDLIRNDEDDSYLQIGFRTTAECDFELSKVIRKMYDQAPELIESIFNNSDALSQGRLRSAKKL